MSKQLLIEISAPLSTENHSSSSIHQIRYSMLTPKPSSPSPSRQNDYQKAASSSILRVDSPIHISKWDSAARTRFFQKVLWAWHQAEKKATAVMATTPTPPTQSSTSSIETPPQLDTTVIPPPSVASPIVTSPTKLTPSRPTHLKHASEPSSPSGRARRSLTKPRPSPRANSVSSSPVSPVHHSPYAVRPDTHNVSAGDPYHRQKVVDSPSSAPVQPSPLQHVHTASSSSKPWPSLPSSHHQHPHQHHHPNGSSGGSNSSTSTHNLSNLNHSNAADHERQQRRRAHHSSLPIIAPHSLSSSSSHANPATATTTSLTKDLAARIRRGSLQIHGNSYLGKSPPPPLPPKERRQIYFYHKHEPYYEFTNFALYPVIFDGKQYPTSEHLFQAFKFLGPHPDIAERIRRCQTPSEALAEARANQKYVRQDWFEVNVRKMDEALFHKFSQHRTLRELLHSTGDAVLVEDSDKDSFWGIGKDGKGRNELGKALERLRDRFSVTMPSLSAPASSSSKNSPKRTLWPWRS